MTTIKMAFDAQHTGHVTEVSRFGRGGIVPSQKPRVSLVDEYARAMVERLIGMMHAGDAHLVNDSRRVNRILRELAARVGYDPYAAAALPSAALPPIPRLPDELADPLSGW